MKLRDKFSKNDVVISDEVIASIALNAAKDVEGFGSFRANAPDLFNKLFPSSWSPPKKPIRVSSTDGEIKIQLFIHVLESADIQKVSSEIQTAVKNSVQSMTGKVVSKVNVYIDGIDFCEPKQLNEIS